MLGNGVRSLRFKVLGLDKETFARWKHLANQTKRLRNAIWRLWLTAHTQAGNHLAVAEYMASVIEWHRLDHSTRGPKPRCTIKCFTPEIDQVIREGLRAICPDVNERPFALTIKTVRGSIESAKADHSSFPKWMRILADEEGVPSTSRVQPIPFNKRNAIILPPVSDRDDFQMKVRLDRVEQPGKKIAGSTEDIVVLKTRRPDKKMSSKVAILWKIINDEYEFCGSNIVYNSKSNEFFVHVCYRRGPTPDNPGEQCSERVAYLHPARKRPWLLRIGEYNHWLGGKSGRHVKHVRRQVLSQRWSRQESYHHASTARRGHGSTKAMGKLFLLRFRWQDFVKAANRVLCADAMRHCQEEKCGVLVYFQPTGAVSQSRFLAKEGKDPNRTDYTGWDWSQLAAMLEKRCQDRGIKLVVHKVGQRKSRMTAAAG